VATTPAGAAETADIAARPYPPGWLHRLLGWLDRLPGPAVIAQVGIGVIVSLIYHLQPWTLGQSPFGRLDTVNVYWGVLTTLLLWTAASLDRVARSALDATRPALRLDDVEIERLRYELSVEPAIPSAVALLAAGVLTGLQFAVDPVGSNIVGLATPLVVAAFLGQLLNVGILLVLLLQLLRQMRLVRVTFARSAIIDPFLPGPLSGFSRLTSRAGISLVILTTSGFLIVPASEDLSTFIVTSAPYLVISPIIAAVAFVVPLTGLHGRLAAEKERLQDEAEARLKAVLAELHADVDARDLGRADGLSKTLASVISEREVLAKLPTWPWSTGSFRAVVTAILLPLFLFVVQLLLSRVL
jgi:hypothetical protein